MSAEAPPQDVAFEERLKWLEVVTDSALAHLSVERLLGELLARVRTLMGVDTVAVLLLDPSRQFLIATSAHGIEEEVSQGVRIPIGKGFAGRIAEQKRWVSIEQVDHSNVLNPILRQKGITSLLGVPLLIGGAVLGVLHVGALSRRHFTEQDAALLQLVADRVAPAVQSRMSQAESEAAAVMHRHLLPAALPRVAGLEFAARYVPGARGAVGGDWYDVFTLPSGTMCLVVGDVVGHGLAAALSMSEVRVALRAAAFATEDPAELLTRLDQHVGHFYRTMMTTVLCVMLAPGSDTWHLSSAGHPPPIIAAPAEPATTVAVPPDLPIGIDVGRPRRTTPLSVRPGSVLCLYTDGLVERRGTPIDANIELLCRTVVPQSPESVCIDVMGALVGHATPDDDIALFVIRRS